RRKNILINVVDDAQLSSFIMPAIIKSGDLNIGISTSGKSPALSLALKLELEKTFKKSFGNIIIGLEKLRKKNKGKSFWKKFFNYSVIKDSSNNFKLTKERIKNGSSMSRVKP
ncbi:MAG: hypothetical protein ABIH00_01865, partial [Armatimonadota bacterium]